jgi:hypothetical protein
MVRANREASEAWLRATLQSYNARMTSRAPLILAILLLLLPALYVGSYLALVVPEGRYLICMSGDPTSYSLIGHYRIYPPVARLFYWPLEQIDRNLRPLEWSLDVDWTNEQPCFHD